MSAFENVVGSKLRLKGKALDVKAGGVHKKKKKHKYSHSSLASGYDLSTGGNRIPLADHHEDDVNATDKDGEDQAAKYDDHLTPAERRYLLQTQKLEIQRLAKMATRSHRDRIHEFNQYLANLSEHYDIPKVGPG